jgi:hypothetical protein
VKAWLTHFVVNFVFRLLATDFFVYSDKKVSKKAPLAEFRRGAFVLARCLTYRAGRHVRVPTITRKIFHDFAYYNELNQKREISEWICPSRFSVLCSSSLNLFSPVGD